MRGALRCCAGASLCRCGRVRCAWANLQSHCVGESSEARDSASLEVEDSVSPCKRPAGKGLDITAGNPVYGEL